jgi:hypothetical protein
VLFFVPRDAYFALADEAKRQGIEFGGHVPIEVRAGEASASRTGPDAPSGFRNQALSSHRLTKRQLVQTMLVARDLRGLATAGTCSSGMAQRECEVRD